MHVTQNLATIQERIAAAAKRTGRSPEDVTIVAVTKYVSLGRAEEAVEAGIIHLGENRPEGLSEKRAAIGDRAVWHFIGTLQSRKVKDVIHQADFIHSLDRLSLAKELNRRADAPVNCFVQVNVSGEEAKHGLAPDEVVPFIHKLEQYEHIRVCGLMTMAPLTDDEDVLRSCFKKLAALRETVQALSLPYASCEELSMGMSNDFEIAVEEGATIIRIGTALVGEQ